MTARVPNFFPERINMRVPNMSYDGALGMNPKGPHYIDMQDPGTTLAAATTTAIMNAQTMAADGAFFAASAFVGGVLPMYVPSRGRWGRTLQFVASGANTGVLEVVGRDYLNQRIVKRVTLNGNTPVTGTSGACINAFCIIESVQVISGSGAVNISIGTQNVFGLPYKATALVTSFQDGIVAGTAHTLVTGVATDPATNATSDPRGLISFNNAPNASRTYGALLMFDDNNLHGVAHFGG